MRERSLADDAVLLEQAEAAYYAGDTCAARALLEVARARLRRDRDNPLVLEATLRAAFCLLLVERRDDPLLITEASGWVDRYANLRPDSAESLAFGAERAIAMVGAAESIPEMQLACSEALGALEQAQQRHAGHLHVALVSAQFYYALPEALGGGREKARPFYLSACRDATHGEAMRALFEKKYPAGA